MAVIQEFTDDVATDETGAAQIGDFGVEARGQGPVIRRGILPLLLVIRNDPVVAVKESGHGRIQKGR